MKNEGMRKQEHRPARRLGKWRGRAGQGGRANEWPNDEKGGAVEILWKYCGKVNKCSGNKKCAFEFPAVVQKSLDFHTAHRGFFRTAHFFNLYIRARE